MLEVRWSGLRPLRRHRCAPTRRAPGGEASDRDSCGQDRRAKEIELYTKLLRAGKLHASFKVIGTLSNQRQDRACR